MLEAVLRHIKNWFVVPNGIHHGAFVVEGGSIALPFLSEGQYYRVIGSLFNDGLHKYGDSKQMTNESFDGTIWALSIPAAVVEIADEVKAWEDKNGNHALSPFQSESFENYSYTKAADKNGGSVTWESAFKKRLDPWRKARSV